MFSIKPESSHKIVVMGWSVLPQRCWKSNPHICECDLICRLLSSDKVIRVYPNPIRLCPYKKGKFGCKDRYTENQDDMKAQGEDNHLQAKKHQGVAVNL